MLNLFENQSTFETTARPEDGRYVLTEFPEDKVQKKETGRLKYFSAENQRRLITHPGRWVKLSDDPVDDSYISTLRKQAQKLSPRITVKGRLVEHKGGTYKAEVFAKFEEAHASWS